jgi:hypothetical protein
MAHLIRFKREPLFTTKKIITTHWSLWQWSVTEIRWCNIVQLWTKQISRQIDIDMHYLRFQKYPNHLIKTMNKIFDSGIKKIVKINNVYTLFYWNNQNNIWEEYTWNPETYHKEYSKTMALLNIRTFDTHVKILYEEILINNNVIIKIEDNANKPIGEHVIE